MKQEIKQILRTASKKNGVGKVKLADFNCSLSFLKKVVRGSYHTRIFDNHIYFCKDKFNMLDFDWRKI